MTHELDSVNCLHLYWCVSCRSVSCRSVCNSYIFQIFNPWIFFSPHQIFSRQPILNKQNSVAGQFLNCGSGWLLILWWIWCRPGIENLQEIVPGFQSAILATADLLAADRGLQCGCYDVWVIWAKDGLVVRDQWEERTNKLADIIGHCTVAGRQLDVFSSWVCQNTLDERQQSILWNTPHICHICRELNPTNWVLLLVGFSLCSWTCVCLLLVNWMTVYSNQLRNF